MSQARYERILDREVREAVPELAGRRVRFLTLFVWFEDRVPVEVSRADGMLLTFDAADRQLQAAVELMNDSIVGRSETGVISAAGRFKTAGYRWTPTRDEVEAAIAVHGLRGSST